MQTHAQHLLRRFRRAGEAVHHALQRRKFMQHRQHIPDRITAVQDDRQRKLLRKRELLPENAKLRRFVVSLKMIIQTDLADRLDRRMRSHFPQRTEIALRRQRTFRMHADRRNQQRRILLRKRNAGCGIRQRRAADHTAPDTLFRKRPQQRIPIRIECRIGIMRMAVKYAQSIIHNSRLL